MEERESYRIFLTEFRDCFAWSYKEMPGLGPHVATRKLAIDPRFRPVKQQPRRVCPKLQSDIVPEVDKLIIAGFINDLVGYQALFLLRKRMVSFGFASIIAI